MSKATKTKTPGDTFREYLRLEAEVGTVYPADFDRGHRENLRNPQMYSRESVAGVEDGKPFCLETVELNSLPTVWVSWNGHDDVQAELVEFGGFWKIKLWEPDYTGKMNLSETFGPYVERDHALAFLAQIAI